MLNNIPLNMNSWRSIGLIVDEMIEMLREFDYKSITITKLTRRAGLVRKTFYAHFDTKEDVLLYYVYSLFKDEFEQYKEEGTIEEVDFIASYFQIWNEHKEFLRTLERNNLLSLLGKLDKNFSLLCDDYFVIGECGLSKEASEYAASVYMDALASILKRWIRYGFKETPEQLTSIFYELVSI